MWSEGRSEWQSLSSISDLWAEVNRKGPDSSTAGIAFFLYYLYCFCFVDFIIIIIVINCRLRDNVMCYVGPADDVDEFEKWQREIKEAEAQVEGSEFGSFSREVGGGVAVADSERPSTPPDGEEEFTDDDGTNYKWDRNLRAWVPQVGT